MIRVPGDKSISHRALIFGALALGKSEIRGLLDAADCRSTAAVLAALGVSIRSQSADIVTVDGVDLRGLRESATVLNCGNSGTTARLMMGVLAGIGCKATIDGDASLRSRPMRRVTGPLSEAGARFEELTVKDRLPIRVIHGIKSDIRHASPNASAQVKSALLLAALVAGRAAEVQEPMMSRDHTELFMKALGVPIVVTDQTISLARWKGTLPAFSIEIPADPSSASYFAAWAALTGEEVTLVDVLVNPSRTGFFDSLAEMGSSVKYANPRERFGEQIADVVVKGNSLSGIEVPASRIPSMIDELPLLACVASRAVGDTVVSGAGELRVKESDRIKATVENITAIGGRAEEHSDGFVVHGSSSPLNGRIEVRQDHRIAMSFAILAAAGHKVEIDDLRVVDVSFPQFWSLLSEVAHGS